MRVGVPREIKPNEHRVGLTPASVSMLVREGHEVFVETGAGAGLKLRDDTYESVGARIVASAGDVFDEAELIVKVKEPQPVECKMLRERHTLFTYLHLAADPEQANLLCESGCLAIAYETVTDRLGRLPLLQPMSEVAGRMSIQAAARSLELSAGGAGVLLPGVPGVPPANVVILGGGVVGENALQMAIGARASITLFERSLPKLAELERIYGGQAVFAYSTPEAIEDAIKHADVVIGAVLLPGAAAPKLIRRDMLKSMKPGSVLVDVAIDQGGCFETSSPTTHADPTFIVDDVVHYCVANMPGAVPKTSTYALNNATAPFVQRIADMGPWDAIEADPHLKQGVNVAHGRIVNAPVAAALGLTVSNIDAVSVAAE